MHDVRVIGRSIKRKSSHVDGRFRIQKNGFCKTTLSNESLQNCKPKPCVAFDPLQKPNYNINKPPKPMRRRFYQFSITKMCRLVQNQSRFLYEYVQHHDPTNIYTQTFKALAQHIGVCKVDAMSSQLAFYYASTTMIRGMCIVNNKRKKCIVLGLEHRQSAPSFRLYIAYFSPSKFYYICFMRFLIKQVLYFYGLPNVLTPLILDYIFYGIEKAGFEIVGAHFMDPKHVKGRPSFFAEPSLRPRIFTDLWNGKMNSYMKNSMHYVLKHARRDVQVQNLRIESNIYMNLICG